MSDIAVPNELEQPAVTGPRREIEELLLADPSRLGDIYRWLQQGLDEKAIRDRVGAKDTAFVYSYKQVITAALDGTTTARGRTSQRQVIGALNSLITKAAAFPISASAVQLLVEHRAAVEASGAVEDEVTAAKADEEEREEAKRTLDDLEGVAGIYAFSYGWYLEHPADPERNTTFIKVGKAINVAGRIKEHAGVAGGVRAHMPEPLALVRVYSGARLTDELDAIERQFHALLSTAGHTNPRRSQGRRDVGREWFLTNPEFLDKIAEVIGLDVVFSGWSEFAEEE